MTFPKTLILLLIFLSLCIPACAKEEKKTILEPSLVLPNDAWQLGIEIHGNPQPISITLPGKKLPTRYWYLPYTIHNNTGMDVDYYPKFELMTDTLKLYGTSRKSYHNVFLAIRKLFAKSIPLLEHENNVTGKILQGQDNARDSVIIFEDFDPNAVNVKIFITGLSNDYQSIDHPTKIDNLTNKPKQVLLRKTLMLQYHVPGDGINLDDRVMHYRDRKWIMR